MITLSKVVLAELLTLILFFISLCLAFWVDRDSEKGKSPALIAVWGVFSFLGLLLTLFAIIITCYYAIWS
jgi:hypothetical protein